MLWKMSIVKTEHPYCHCEEFLQQATTVMKATLTQSISKRTLILPLSQSVQYLEVFSTTILY